MAQKPEDPKETQNWENQKKKDRNRVDQQKEEPKETEDWEEQKRKK